MLLQIIVCVGIGFAGIIYLVIYERTVMVPILRQKGVGEIVRQRIRWLRQRDIVLGAAFPGLEEAVVRGLPMLLVQDVMYLAAVLLVVNVGFMAAHADRNTIGNRRWLLRYARGLIYSVPALFGSLYGCLLLHSAWNVGGAVKYWNNDPRGRIYIWTRGPLEILTETTATPSKNFAKFFRQFHAVKFLP